ncbi:MAG TPA: PEP-CTERM sorting domain-containing protein [Alphaproteobacteria bacterium]|nr:PEP-CTERM sorting domain-containing protein [Alphaproteobacteria bacterium]
MNKLFLIALILFGFATSQRANADAIFTLNYDSCSGGCGLNGQGTSNNNFGYVTLHQVDASTVSVTVSLSQDVGLDTDFVNTGNGFNHEPFAFNVDKLVTVTGISNPYFIVGPSPDAISGLGTFSNTIACASNCPPGASGADLLGDSLIFTTSDGSSLSISDFVANSKGYFFAADVIGPSGNTGEVAANGAPIITNGSDVPEPTSIALLGSSLIALGAVRFLRRPLNVFRR